MADKPSQDPPRTPPAPRWLSLLLVGLVTFRLAYHLTYIEVSPFALGTFSDGRVYEAAARDLLAHPPLGTEPFYLQGLYAYFMALFMLIRADVSLALLGQLVVAGLTLWLFHRVATQTLGRTAGSLSTVALMASPGLWFYENKFLSAELGVAASVVMLWGFARYRASRSRNAAGILGLTCALAVLARPNMLLVLPFGAGAIWMLKGRTGERLWWHDLAALGLGFLLGVAPMAARNLAVTGTATFMPAHGGGTSFFIGNNPQANGVWNTAGGLLTPEVVRERTELARTLGVPDTAAAVGSELYGRAFRYMKEDPGDYLALQVKKVWLTTGNTELTQDYDLHGEAEMIPWAHRLGAPFGVVFALGVVGLLRLRRVTAYLPWLWILVGQIVAVGVANVVFFTSAQHRLPLLVPLAFAAGPAVADLWEYRGRRRQEIVLAVLLAAQAFWPRARKDVPSAIHHFNMAVVLADAGQQSRALEAISRAVAVRPEHPLIRLEHARLLWRTHHWDEAERELDWLDGLEGAPSHVRDQARRIRQAVRADREDAALRQRLGLEPIATER